ncbi:MAG: tRNA-dihydrouridine synthase family protein [Bacteroides sp.]|nr:tRNA-dihydrouridine synthase family protein [Bacteroides sp.]
MKFHFAPVQGHTDAAYRHFHAKNYGALTDYYTPFIRLEKGTIRQRDLKDFSSDLNSEVHLVPQIIFRDKDELNSLVEILKENGATEIDLNMGCPFPLQTGHGRGAATIANDQLASDVETTVKENPDVKFSLKMRLGFIQPDEWKTLLPHLNNIHLEHIAVHPRVAKQQYGGELHLNQFEELLKVSTNPVIFNGEIHSPDDIRHTIEQFPDIAGIMIGRGLLNRPSLIAEYISGKDMDKEHRLELMLKFHRQLLEHYSSILCGESQIISKIKPFWEYAESEIGKKSYKAIKKASNIAKYHSAVASILS